MYVRAVEMALSIYNDGSAKSKWYYPTIVNGIRLSKNCSYETRLTQLNFYHLSLHYVQNWTILNMFADINRADIVIIDTMKYFNGHYVYVIKAIEKFDIKANDSLKYFSKNNNDEIFEKVDDSIEEPIYNIENILSFTGNKRNRNLISEILSNKYYFYHEIYVDDKDFSVVYYKYFSRLPHNIQEKSCTTELGISTSFEKFNNTWYPKLMNYYDETLWFANKKDTTKYITTKVHILMSVNKLILKDVKPFNKEKTLNDDSHFDYLSDFKNDTIFWNNYNYYPDDNLRNIVFKDLEYFEKQHDK